MRERSFWENVDNIGLVLNMLGMLFIHSFYFINKQSTYLYSLLEFIFIYLMAEYMHTYIHSFIKMIYIHTYFFYIIII